MENVILLDMDGTITPPRKPIEPEMIDALFELSKVSKIGIVTGSGLDYVLQQCSDLLKPAYNMKNFFLLPCNGTQKYEWSESDWENGYWTKTFNMDMREFVGEDKFNKTMSFLTEQLYITHLTNPPIPKTGHFISYRGSLINWCPIGRQAIERDRKAFIEYDKENKLRRKKIAKFKESFMCDFLSFSMGGNTSIDIYPVGWDKTQALNHFINLDPWFIGDRCTVPTGNDKPLYDKIRADKPDQAFEVKSTTDTLKIVKKITKKLNNQE